MILIAESGSTKSHWVLCNTKGVKLEEYSTIGFNPYFIDHDSILNHLKKSTLSRHKLEINNIYFYGAGCSNKEVNTVLELAFSDFFENAEILIRHDLEAACYATYKEKPNITCILGTGANSCFFDGNKITEKSPSLGFILGDEASGNYFGKKILNTYFNNLLPKELKSELEKGYETNIKNIINQVYNNKRANVFLAEYFPFIYENRTHPFIQNIIYESLNNFINLHIKCFENYSTVEINFVGSVAHFLSEEIHQTMSEEEIQVGRIIKDPINNLVNYHFKKE